MNIQQSLRRLASAIALALVALTTPSKADDLCPNMFPNLIADICWSCIFPIKLMGVKLPDAYSQEDFSTDADKPICICTQTLEVGIPRSMWEMAYIVDVHTAPGCMPTLGGVQLPLSWVQDQYGKIDSPTSPDPSAFRNATYYIAPLMYLLEAVLDDPCSDKSAFDVGWQSEFDPTWSDDELALIKMPIAFAFGSLPGVMAAGIDSAMAMTGFPSRQIFWHAGGWGPLYPITGNVRQHKSADNTGHLIAARMLAEAHAMKEMSGLFSGGGGRTYACENGESGCDDDFSEAVMCAITPKYRPDQLIMPKRQYKFQRLFPTPETANKCCVPIGRSIAMREKNTQMPLKNYKDFGYAIFRKRDCCNILY